MNDLKFKANMLRSKKFRRRILEISQGVTALHAAPAFSCLELVEYIYFNLISNNNSLKDSDIFIMSKGHGYLAQLVILEELGILDKKFLDSYCTPEGLLGAHPDLGIPGIMAATGSLGHGLGISLGMALKEKVDSLNSKRIAKNIFCLISDGELQEGSVWEAIIVAGSLNVDNLVVIVDNNDFQSLGRTSITHPSLYPITNKFQEFGFDSIQTDGHDYFEIHNNFAKLLKSKKPKALVALTTKGKGVSFMENSPIWHYRSPNSEEYQKALKDLDLDNLNER